MAGYVKMQQHNFAIILMSLLNTQIGRDTNSCDVAHSSSASCTRFTLASHYDTFEKRSEIFAKVLNDMRQRDCLHALRGWRDEVG